LVLPAPPRPDGLYQAWSSAEWPIATVSYLGIDDAGNLIAGCLGQHDALETARRAAVICTLRGLSAFESELGDLAAIARFVFVRGFVNAEPAFVRHGQVIDAASELLVELFGGAGRHARSSLGCAGLPSGGLVEIEFVAAVSVD
jgi:enamine deaminase RidA (YjgF/YER057c/UK114 family)